MKLKRFTQLEVWLNTEEIHFKLKGIFSDSNYIFLWHESEDMNKKKNLKNPEFQNLSWFQFYLHKLSMIMWIGIAP